MAVSSALMHYNSDVPRRQVRDVDLKKDIHTGCFSSYKNADICSFDVFKNICQVLCLRTHWLSHNFVVTKFRLHIVLDLTNSNCADRKTTTHVPLASSTRR